MKAVLVIVVGNDHIAIPYTLEDDKVFSLSDLAAVKKIKSYEMPHEIRCMFPQEKEEV